MATASNTSKKVENPFPGLRAFQQEDAELFFGRDEEVNVSWDILSRTHFLTVLGKSGSGKTSLVQAGLIAELEKGKWDGRGGNSWRIAHCIPYEDPMKSLIDALQKPGVLAPEVGPDPGIRNDIEEHLRRNSRGLIDAFLDSDMVDLDNERKIKRFNGNLLVFVDQFENIFKSDDPNFASLDAISFVNLLVTASKALNYPIYIVLGFQSDFIGNITEFSGLTEAIMEGRLVMPSMNYAQMQEAIEKPIEKQGVKVDLGLTHEIIDHVKYGPLKTDEQLSALQYIMRRIWAMRHDANSGLSIEKGDATSPDTLVYNKLSENIISVEAISTDLDEIFERFDTEKDASPSDPSLPGNKWICETIFKALTEKRGENLYLQRTHQVSVLELAQITSVSEKVVIPVIEAFSMSEAEVKPFQSQVNSNEEEMWGVERDFLKSSDHPYIFPESYIEIAHPFIIERWDRLKIWMDEELKNGVTYQNLLKKSREEWQDGEGKLLKNKRLQDPDLTSSWILMFPDMKDFKCKEISKKFYQGENTGNSTGEVKMRPNKFWGDRYKNVVLGDPSDTSNFTLGDDPYAFHTHAIAYLKASKEEDCLQESLATNRTKNRQIRDRITIIILGILALAALIALIGASWLAIQASISTYKAKQNENEALIAQLDAEISRAKAEAAKIRADSARALAELREYKLDTAQQRLTVEIARANTNYQLAKENEAQAQANLFIAEIKAEEANRNARIARKSKEEALASQKQTLSLSKRIQAQALAANSQRMADDTALQALLAVEGHSLNQREFCDHPDVVFNELDPNIYLALNKALETLESDDYNTVLINRVVKEDPELENDYLHQGVIRGMTFSPKFEEDSASRDFLFTSSGDGRIYKVQPNELQYFDNTFKKDDLEWLQHLRNKPTALNPVFLGPYNKASILPPKLFKIMALSTNQKWIALGGWTSSIYMYSTLNPAADPRKIYMYDPEKKPNPKPKKVEAHRGQGVFDIVPIHLATKHMGFMSTGGDGIISYFNWESTDPVAVALFEGDKNDPIMALTYNEVDSMLAGGSKNGEIYVWKLQVGENESLKLNLTTRLTHRDAHPITAIRFGPDKNILITGHENGNVEIWDVEQKIYDYKTSHRAAVTDIQFSDDYRFLATSSYDRSVLVYTRTIRDEKSRGDRAGRGSIAEVGIDFFTVEPLRLRGQSQNDLLPWATSLAFDPNAKNLFVGYRNGIIKKWSLEPAKMSQRIMRALDQQQRATCIEPKNWVRFMGKNRFYCDPEKQPPTKCQ